MAETIPADVVCVAAEPARVIRAVTVPVEQPITTGWGGLNEAMRAAFGLSTDLANWAVHYLFRRDDPTATTTPDGVKPGKKSEPHKAYLYGAAVREFPDWETRCAGVASNAQCVFRAIHKKYLQDRFAIHVKHESALLTYRYPYPFPIHNANWSVAFATGPWPGEAPVLTISLPGLGQTALKLSRGQEFARQISMLRQFVDGTAEQGEAALLRDRKGRLLVKLVGHFPLRGRGTATNVAFIHTDPNSLLVVEINGRAANVTNGDHIRRIVARHRAFLQRSGEDKKRELRMDDRQRKNLEKYVGERCGKQRDRLDTVVKQIAAQVAGICERRGVGMVAYDDSNREFLRTTDDVLPFPWHALKTRLSQLLVGEMSCGWIDGRYAQLGTTGEKDEWLRQAQATLAAAKKVAAHKSRPRRKSHPAVSPRRET